MTSRMFQHMMSAGLRQAKQPQPYSQLSAILVHRHQIAAVREGLGMNNDVIPRVI